MIAYEETEIDPRWAETFEVVEGAVHGRVLRLLEHTLPEGKLAGGSLPAIRRSGPGWMGSVCSSGGSAVGTSVPVSPRRQNAGPGQGGWGIVAPESRKPFHAERLNGFGLFTAEAGRAGQVA